MKFLAIERTPPGIDAVSCAPYLTQEAARTWELIQRGVIREIYFTPAHTAVLVLECRDNEEADAVLGSLPLKKRGLIDFEMCELRPYDGFARLFAGEV